MKSFPSPRPGTVRHKATSSMSSTTLNQDSCSQINTSRAHAAKMSEHLDPKMSTVSDCTHRSNSPGLHHQALKDLSNLVGESLLCGNLGSAGGTPLDLSFVNGFSDPVSTPAGSYKKIVDELSSVKRELEQKNAMIDKLMKENMNLRKEMEEFLSTVDEAREYIDLELKECNNRIQELENEIQEVRAENQVYKQQLEKSIAAERRPTSAFGGEMENYYGQAKKEMEDFYFRLNEQIINFMEISKKQYQEFNKVMQTKAQENQCERVLVPCASSPQIENIAPPLSSPLSVVKTNIPQTARHQSSSISISYKNSRSPTKTAIKTPRTPNTLRSLGIENRAKTPRNILDSAASNRNIEQLQSGSLSSRTSRVRGSCASISPVDLNTDHSALITLSNLNNDLSGHRNPTSHALSPKSSLLRAKLKSDMILQEMRRKIGEGFGHL